VNCFYHPTVVAVGTCKSCCKGLCSACAVDLGKGLACKGRCEGDVKAVITLIDDNLKRSVVSREILDSAKKNRYIGAISNFLFGIIFLGFPLYNYTHGGFWGADYLLIAMGSLFLLIGIYSFVNASRLSRPSK